MRSHDHEATPVEELWSRITVILSVRQVVYLDRLSAEIRTRTGESVRRTELIRAFVDAVEESGIDVADAASEDELRELLRAVLSRSRRG